MRKYVPERMIDIVRELRHARALFRAYRSNDRAAATEREVAKQIILPQFQGLRQTTGTQVWAVGVVRNEVDVVRDVLEHLLEQGLSGILIADHSSTDGTRQILDEIAAQDRRVFVATDKSTGHYQKEKMTHLSRVAHRLGAKWIIPFDADEFWFAPSGTLGTWLPTRDASVVRATMMNCVPLTSEPRLKDREYLWAPGSGMGKVAFRGHARVLVGPGNHSVLRPGRRTDGLKVVHVPYRSPEQMSQKFHQGAAALAAAEAPSGEGRHWRSGSRMSTVEVTDAWQLLRAGEAVPAIGWSLSEAAQTGHFLR